MLPDDNSHAASKTSWFWLLGMAIILILVALSGILLVWATRPNRVVATAMFRVSSQPETILGPTTSPGNTADFQLVKKTQLAALKSSFLYTAVLRKPGIASLAILAPHEDPVKWLTDQILCEYPEDGEYLSISLEGSEENAPDLQRIVDAVARSYLDEVVFKDRQRQLGERDLLATIVDKLNHEIAEKSDTLADIMQELGPYADAGNAAMHEVVVNRLDRIEAEIMRLENDQLRLAPGGDQGELDFIEKRIVELRERQAKLENAIGSQSAELAARRDELRRLRQLSDELSTKLERLEIEANAPQRIEQVQGAIVAPVGEKSP